MLKAEVLRANEPLKELTDEQIRIIVALSKNDEEQMKTTIVREVHDRYDQDIEELTGLKREPTEKTYKFLKRAVGAKLEGVEELNKTIKTLEAEKKELLEKGDDQRIDELTKQIKEKTDRIELMKTKHAEALKEKENEIQMQMSSLEDFKVSSMFQGSVSGVKLDDTIPQAARDAVVQQTEQYVKGLKREWIDGKLRFLDDNDEIMRDKTTLEPLTIEAITKQRLQPITAGERKGGGAGGKAPKGKTGSLLEAKDKGELTELARQQAMSEGLSPTDLTGKFQARVDELYNENVANIGE